MLILHLQLPFLMRTPHSRLQQEQQQGRRVLQQE